METSEVAKIIQALAQGIDPVTGEVFPDASPYNHPTIIRALFYSLNALECLSEREERERRLPDNAGKPWSEDEDRLLVEAFDSGTSLKQIAAKHSRTDGAIAARLEAISKILGNFNILVPPCGHGTTRRADRFPMGSRCTTPSCSQASIRRSGPAAAGGPRRPQRHSLDSALGSALAGSARAVSAVPNLPPALPVLGA